MLSRVANSIYWMARYLERADCVARFIDVNTHLMLDLALDQNSAQWYPLVATSGDDEDFTKRYKQADERAVVKFMTFDQSNPNSILQCIFRARENARTVREVIPVEMWEKINELYHLTQSQSRKRSVADLADYYKEVRQSGHLFTGLMHNTMSRDMGWQFAHLGQMLERADKTARLLDVKYFLLLPHNDVWKDSAYDAVQWGAVLKSVNALEMYRQQFHTINYRDVTQFLLFSKAFPRSVQFCLEDAEAALKTLTNGNGDSKAAREMATLCRTIRNSDTSHIISAGLHEFIDIFQANLNLVDEAIYESYFEN